MSKWAKKWVLDGATGTVAPLILNADGITEFRLEPNRKSHPIYYTVRLTSSDSAPAGWKDIVLFPRGMREVPDTFSIAGQLNSGTANQYLVAADTQMRSSITQTVNNFRLEGDLAVVGSTGDCATVTLYRVQRAAAPKDWYVVVYVTGGDKNPDGAGIGHNN